MADIHNEELAAFVTSTLNAISLGIGEAVQVGGMKFALPREIEFEVAVTATRSKEGGAGFKIQVFDVQGKASAENQDVSRIRFSVQTISASHGKPIDTTMLRRGIA